jgi:hypothetical protein
MGTEDECGGDWGLLVCGVLGWLVLMVGRFWWVGAARIVVGFGSWGFRDPRRVENVW